MEKTYRKAWVGGMDLEVLDCISEPICFVEEDSE